MHQQNIIDGKNIFNSVPWLWPFSLKRKNKCGSCDTNWTKERKKHDRHLSMKTIKYKESSRHRNVKTKRHVYKINYSPGKAQQSQFFSADEPSPCKDKKTKNKTKLQSCHRHLEGLRISIFPSEATGNASCWMKSHTGQTEKLPGVWEVKVGLWLFTSLIDPTAQWCSVDRRHWLFFSFSFFLFN